jgi:RNA-directed DNA polymerase
VISPLVANLYMNRFLKHWRQSGRGEALQAHVINYADDFVILSRGHAAEALAWTDRVMTRLGLSLNRTKTGVRDARQERFDFLGYSFGPHCFRQTGRWFIGASPSKKSVQRLKDKVAAILVPGNMGTWEGVRDTLNRLMRGWCAQDSPHFSNWSKYVCEERLLVQHLRETLHQRAQPLFAHGRD